MSNQSMPWFRMYTDFLNDPKMIALAFEDQRHFIGILALKSDGAIDQDCDENLKNRIVAQRLWIDHAIILDVKKRLINSGLIDSDWQPLGWNKRQFKSDKDVTGAERQKRYREKNSNALRNESVTLTDTDTDTDTDTEHKKLLAKKQKPAFSLPTVEEVKIEMLEQGMHELDANVECKKFNAHHESKGWVIGRSKMKDWRAAVTTWRLNKEKWDKERTNTRASPATAQAGNSRHFGLNDKDYTAGTNAHGQLI